MICSKLKRLSSTIVIDFISFVNHKTSVHGKEIQVIYFTTTPIIAVNLMLVRPKRELLKSLFYVNIENFGQYIL